MPSYVAAVALINNNMSITINLLTGEIDIVVILHEIPIINYYIYVGTSGSSSDDIIKYDKCLDGISAIVEKVLVDCLKCRVCCCIFVLPTTSKKPESELKVIELSYCHHSIYL